MRILNRSFYCILVFMLGMTQMALADSNVGWCRELSNVKLTPKNTMGGSIISSSSDMPVTTLDIRGDSIALAGSFYGFGRSVLIYDLKTQKWDSLEGGVQGYVKAVLFHDHDLYVAGSFNRAGSVACSNIARWNLDERKWYTMGEGLVGQPECLAWYKNELYVGGSIIAAPPLAVRSVARWDGQRWNALGTGVTNGVYSGSINTSCVYNDILYFGGNFRNAGADTLLSLAAGWNGSNWVPMPHSLRLALSDDYRLYVSQLSEYNGSLLVNGFWYNVLDSNTEIVSPGNLVYDGSTWKSQSQVYSGGLLTSYSQSVSGDYLIRVGTTSYLQTTTQSIEYYNSHSKLWRMLDTVIWNNGYGVPVGPVGMHGSDMIVCGRYTRLANTAIQNLGLINLIDDTVRPLDSTHTFTASNELRAIGSLNPYYFTHHDTLFIAGLFSFSGMSSSNGIAYWSGASSRQWYGFGPGFSEQIRGKEVAPKMFIIPSVYCACSYRDTILIGGDFEKYASQRIENFLYYSGSAAGMFHGDLRLSAGAFYNSLVSTLLPTVNGLYVAGAFKQAGAETVESIAFLQDDTWNSVGGGLRASGNYYGATVKCLVSEGDSAIWAGGIFTHDRSGKALCGLSRWDGTQWTAPGLDVRDSVGSVNSIVMHEGMVYCGGEFLTRGNSIVNGIAVWDGTVWTDLDGGIVGDGHINSMVWYRDRLIVAGKFSAIGAIAANNIAAWDSKTKRWSALGDGCQGEIAQVFLYHDTVFVSGDITRAADYPCYKLAAWTQAYTVGVDDDSQYSSEHSTVDEARQLELYPNPCSHHITIRCNTYQNERTPSSQSVMVNCRILDLLGNEVHVASMDLQADHFIYNTAVLPSGSYCVEVRTADGRVTRRVFSKL